MSVAILGMHRSGTSLTAKLLKLCGFHLGADADLVPADPNNADGYWEHRGFQAINEEILARHGGGWDLPPDLPPGWEASPKLNSLRETAQELIQKFQPQEPWLWKDPRTTLTLPFWKSLLPNLRTVICVRNPLEVALSLNRRGSCSYPFALRLWQTYAEQALDGTDPATRVVVHYGALMQDAIGSLERILAGLGYALSAEARDACAAAARPDLRHARMSLANLHALRIPAMVTERYLQLCDEAGYTDDGPPGVLTNDPQTLDWISTTVREFTRHEGRRRGSELHQLRRELAERDETIRDLLEDLQSQIETNLPPKQAAYRRVVRSLKAFVQEHVAPTDIVAVVSKGDDTMLKLRPATAWHFPQDEQGHYAGYHPAGDLAAVAHLEVLRSRGATHFLLPEPYAWWLQTYPGLRRHLERRATLVARRDGAGLLYALSHSRTEPDATDVLATVAEALGRTPQVLNWHAGDAVATAFPQSHIFAPPAANGTLPYLDHSIDVVAVKPDTSNTAAMLAEAQRVATAAVIDMTATPRVHWKKDFTTVLPGVSIVIPVFNQWPVTKGCLTALFDTLPQSLVEVIVVDDQSTDTTARELARWAARELRLKVLRNDVNSGFVDSCNRGAAVATLEYLLFLNNDTVPLPGWLPPLLRTFERFPDCGAVGGKLLHPDGRLQEAGGIIFSDGSACHFGRDEPDATRPLFNTVRAVDYVSGALLLTPRKLFQDLGGFDSDYRPGYYEDTDYCFRLREHGKQVYQQPDSVVVHLEGRTAGRDHSQGMKRYQELNRRRFQARHAAALAEQRCRPATITGGLWPMLATRGKGPVST